MILCNYHFIMNNGIEFDIIDTGGLPVVMTDNTKMIGFNEIDTGNLPVLMMHNNLELYTKLISKLKSN